MLLAGSKRRPSQVQLRRALSTAYYALFHALARNCADMLIGTTKKSRSDAAWLEVYRSLGHGTAKSACEDGRINKFPSDIHDFAVVFAELQSIRHAADYDPSARFRKTAVRASIDRAKIAIDSFGKAPTKHRRAFASWVLFRNATRSR